MITPGEPDDTVEITIKLPNPGGRFEYVADAALVRGVEPDRDIIDMTLRGDDSRRFVPAPARGVHLDLYVPLRRLPTYTERVKESGWVWPGVRDRWRHLCWSCGKWYFTESPPFYDREAEGFALEDARLFGLQVCSDLIDLPEVYDDVPPEDLRLNRDDFIRPPEPEADEDEEDDNYPDCCEVCGGPCEL